MLLVEVADRDADVIDHGAHLYQGDGVSSRSCAVDSSCRRRVLVALPATAHAGRTFYGWLYGTEVMPERGVELQTWISTRRTSTSRRQTLDDLGASAPSVGITDQLELGLPIEIVWFAHDRRRAPACTRSTQLRRRAALSARDAGSRGGAAVRAAGPRRRRSATSIARSRRVSPRPTSSLARTSPASCRCSLDVGFVAELRRRRASTSSCGPAPA